ncbi:MAG: D-aminoacylase [Planctomycetaceae bacterium TMED240]|nr:D-aminoacylase [Rhodopirellula sp.]OUX07018.1 MAG: D-aminoacylase [Planctomycetaceae bacterium TMED240]
MTPRLFHLRALFRTLVVLVIASFTSSTSYGSDVFFDVVIRGGTVIDGTGKPRYIADIAVKDGRVTFIGNNKEIQAEKVIDATGLVVAPGFIDMMGQTASPMIHSDESAYNLLTQGITTINAGEGESAAPLSPNNAKQAGYSTMREYFALLELTGLPVNLVQTVGHTQIRRLVLGDVERRPNLAELEEMKQLTREAMQAGAIGVSTALIYPPAVYAQPREISALAAVAGEFGGGYFTHMRNEGDRLLEAVEEALQIGRDAKTPVHIFHLKAAGKANWGKLPRAIELIKNARASGQQVTADIYPYINNGLGIAALIHPRHFTSGRSALIRKLADQKFRSEVREEMESTAGWENWYRHAGHDWNRIVIGKSNHPRYRKWDGLPLAQIAKASGEDPWDTFFNLVVSGAFALPETMSEANKVIAIKQDFISFCTDVGPVRGGRNASHPRAFGAFPRIIARYVKEQNVISLERMVAQASAAAAQAVYLFDRGKIEIGAPADLIVFDQEGIVDKASFRQPDAVSQGMKFVLVNGQVVLQSGQLTNRRPGRVLRGPGYRPELAAHHVKSSETKPPFENYDRSMAKFLEKHRLPGASIAVTNDSKVVFANGYGYADVALGKKVHRDSLFRIASISKPITAVAILQLHERGKLDLDDSVFMLLELNDVIQTTEGTEKRLRDITVRHLLQHRGGWDRNVSFDAMFRSVTFAEKSGGESPADQQAVIDAMLKQPLDFAPGERYAYSNFGYCLLGRVIEKLSGQSYESYVKQNVLDPVGATKMRLGATRLTRRAENEVRYYHPGTGTSVFQSDLKQQVPHPYGAWNLEAMDSHGGWLASATDLAKFAAAFDNPATCPILSEASIELMHQRPPGVAGYGKDGSEKTVYYSFGWSNRVVRHGKLNHWHTGSLPGTASILIRRHDGKNFVALMNSRVSPVSEHLGREMDQLLHQMANQVKTWPKE